MPHYVRVAHCVFFFSFQDYLFASWLSPVALLLPFHKAPQRTGGLRAKPGAHICVCHSRVRGGAGGRQRTERGVFTSSVQRPSPVLTKHQPTSSLQGTAPASQSHLYHISGWVESKMGPSLLPVRTADLSRPSSLFRAPPILVLAASRRREGLMLRNQQPLDTRLFCDWRFQCVNMCEVWCDNLFQNYLLCICYVLFVTWRNKVGNKWRDLFCVCAHNLGPKSAIQMMFLKISYLDTKVLIFHLDF